MSTNCFIVNCIAYYMHSDTSTIVIMTYFIECGRENQVSTILQHQHTSLQISEVCRTYSLMWLCTK